MMKAFRKIFSLTFILLFFSSDLWGGEVKGCAIEDYFVETRISNSIVIFYGERIERKDLWAGPCGKRTIQECPVSQIKHKVKVLEVYKGSPPQIVTFHTDSDAANFTTEPGAVRKVLSVVDAPDYDEVFFSSRYLGGFFHDNCSSLYEVFARNYLDSYFKDISLADSIHRLKISLERLYWVEKEKKISKAPNPFSKKSPSSPPPEPPLSKRISAVLDVVISKLTIRRDGGRRYLSNFYLNPIGELFSLWVSKYPEFEKEIIKRFKEANYRLGQLRSKDGSAERDLLRLLAMSLSGSKKLEARKEILPVLYEDFEVSYPSIYRKGFRPYLYEVAAYHLAKTGLPEVKEYLEPLVLKENPKQLLALWALNLFNKNAEREKEKGK